MSGKYAAFVVGAYAVSAIAFAWMVLDTALRGRAARRKLESLEKGRDG